MRRRSVQFGLHPQAFQVRVAGIGLSDIRLVGLQFDRAVQDGRVGADEQRFPQSQQDVQVLGRQHEVVLRPLQREPVVGQLHFAAQHVVVRDEPFLLHPADVVQAAFRLLDVAGEDLLPAVEFEKLHVLLQKGQTDVRGIRFGAQRGERTLHARLADGVAQFPSPVDRLREVHGVILRPVGCVGMIGAGEPLPEDGRPAGVASPQADLQVGQPFGPGAPVPVRGRSAPPAHRPAMPGCVGRPVRKAAPREGRACRSGPRRAVRRAGRSEKDRTVCSCSSSS